MFGISSLGYKRKILFHAALNFSPDYPYPTAKFALPETKFFHFRHSMKIQTCSNRSWVLPARFGQGFFKSKIYGNISANCVVYKKVRHVDAPHRGLRCQIYIFFRQSHNLHLREHVWNFIAGLQSENFVSCVVKFFAGLPVSDCKICLA